MSETPLHSVSVSGVTFDNAGRVLLIKRRDNGDWQAPGGVLELHERLEAGVVREVFEETGVEVYVERLTGIYKNLTRGVVAIVYKCGPLGGTPRPTSESVDVAWLTIEAGTALMSPAFAVRILDAAADPPTNAVSRTHDGVNLLD